MADWVDAESPQVGEVLSKILAVVLEGGAELHPGLRVQERGGFMRVLCTGGTAEADVPLVRMPRDRLIPLEGAQWEDRIDRLVLQREPDGLSAVQQELLGLHIDLYNAAGKLPWFHFHLPDALLQEQPALLEAVRKLRPSTGEPWLGIGERFIKTRQCWIPPVQPSMGDSEQAAIFPIVDLANNHHEASGSNFDEENLIFMVGKSDSSDECFLHYGGRRDVLDLALGLGYLDRSIPFAHSAAVHVMVEDIGFVEIDDMRSTTSNIFDPPRLELRCSGMKLSHFTVHRQNMKSCIVAIDLAVQGAMHQRGVKSFDRSKLGANVRMEIARANSMLLHEVERISLMHIETWPSAQLLIGVCRRQKEAFDMIH